MAVNYPPPVLRFAYKCYSIQEFAFYCVLLPSSNHCRTNREGSAWSARTHYGCSLVPPLSATSSPHSQRKSGPQPSPDFVTETARTHRSQSLTLTSTPYNSLDELCRLRDSTTPSLGAHRIPRLEHNRYTSRKNGYVVYPGLDTRRKDDHSDSPTALKRINKELTDLGR